MKCLSLLSMLPSAAIAFQQVVPPVQYKTTSTVDRAEQCATLHDFCDVDELETLALDLKRFQSASTAGGKANKVYDILRTQSELKRMMEDLAADDGEPSWAHDYMHHHW